MASQGATKNQSLQVTHCREEGSSETREKLVQRDKIESAQKLGLFFGLFTHGVLPSPALA
jgi:hypothetical protein